MNTDQIERILEDAIHHFQMYPLDTSLNPVTRPTPTVDISFNPSPEFIRTILWSNLTSEYQQNMRLYQQNMNIFLRQSSSPIITFEPMRTMPLVSSIPTIQQLSNATTLFVFDNETRIRIGDNLTCPITFEDFVEGDILCQIRHCSHVFKEQPLRNWFSQHALCPVCRYDIRRFH